MHCISYTLKRKEEKPLLFKQTVTSRFTCLACQHFGFQATKSLDSEKPFSLALRVVSLFSCLSRLAPSVTRVTICSTDKEKRETARSLWWWRENDRNVVEVTVVQGNNRNVVVVVEGTWKIVLLAGKNYRKIRKLSPSMCKPLQI